ncbi:hypothetical protein C8R45DRAFT_1216437, partial [Mycena sanguinolenta]
MRGWRRRTQARVGCAGDRARACGRLRYWEGRAGQGQNHRRRGSSVFLWWIEYPPWASEATTLPLVVPPCFALHSLNLPSHN